MHISYNYDNLCINPLQIKRSDDFVKNVRNYI